MKKVFKISCFIIFVIFILIVILSYGITTSKFNNKIIVEIEKKVPNTTVDFDNTSVSLDLFSLAIKVKINKPKIKINNQNVSIKSFVIFTDLKSSFQKKYLLKKIKIDFNKNEVSKLKNIILIKNFTSLQKIKFIEGSGFGELIIDQFQSDKIKTVFNGELSNIILSIGEDLPYINKINSKINYSNDKILLSDLSGNFGEFDIVSRELIYSFNKKFLSGAINLKGRLNPTINLEKIFNKKFFINIDRISDISGNFDIDANLKVNFNNDFSIKNDDSTFNLNTKNLKFKYKNFNNITFENINSSLNFNNYGKISSKGEFKINNKKNKFEITRRNNKNPLLIKLSGIIEPKKIFFNEINFPIKNDIKYTSETLLKDLQTFNTKFKINLNTSKIDFSIFNYIKKKGEDSKLEFNFSKSIKSTEFKNINFLSKNNKINIQYLLFDEDFVLKDVGKINVNLGKKNKFNIFKKNNNYRIIGSSVDLSKYLSLKNKKKLPDFKSDISGKTNIQFKKIYLPGEYLIDYENSIQFKKGKIISLDSFANFKDLTSFSHKVLKNEMGNKLLLINSDKAKPFLSNYKFLNGLEKGTLKIKREYLSKNSSITEVKVENFYLKEMPVLTKILSIGSLTGALDILEGKGIFFKEAFLKYELVDNELKILDCYGTGPSLGFVLEGRIGKDDFASLNGSLAPANMINNVIREIPLVGKILTGEKGDGIFGASFKIKGKDNLKVEVNPIKTLTPRFIQRFLKNFKK
tara:strand:+ start:3502 stop:5745 length:2244 start_codon:yes stop_codon:yes gene_type:complete